MYIMLRQNRCTVFAGFFFLLMFACLLPMQAFAGSTSYGIVDRARGYSADFLSISGSATIYIPPEDISYVTRVLVSAKDPWRQGWITLYDGRASSVIQVGYAGTPVMLEMFWKGTLPNGHGRITWGEGTNVVIPPSGPIVTPPSGPSVDTRDLLLHYDFTQPPNGDIVKDLTGNGNDGTIHGALWIKGKGLYFNRLENNYIETDAARLHSDTALTVLVEFTPWSDGTHRWSSIFWKGNKPDCTVGCENREYGLWLSNASELLLCSTPKDKVGIATVSLSAPPFSTNGMAIYSAVIDSTNNSMALFINSALLAKGPYSTAGIRSTEGIFTIGGVPDAKDNFYYHGYIKSIKIYKRAFNAIEIKEASKKRTTPFYKRLTEDDIYFPDDVIVRGAWAAAIHIDADSSFRKDQKTFWEKGFTVEDGFYASPSNEFNTEIIYYHDGSALNFRGYGTVLDRSPSGVYSNAGSVEFMIKGDGKVLWQSGLVLHSTPAKEFNVNLSGVRELRLVVTNGGDGCGQDWAAWLNLKVE